MTTHYIHFPFPKKQLKIKKRKREKMISQKKRENGIKK